MVGPKVGLYLRLSRDDGEDAESQSISNQRVFLHQYLAHQRWTAAAEFADDGYTGTNFDRPGFQRLLGEIEAGRIDTVLTKDLSRLGRDQIGTLYFYQVYFPGKNVRYLSIAEGIDTFHPGGMSKVLPFLAAANDFYPADISGKVRSALTTRKKDGLFIGAQPPLGYCKDPQQKGHLVLDPETAPIIEVVFSDYLTHGSVMGTAKRLTERGIPTPSRCKGDVPTQQRFPGVWSDTMVRRILTNPTYAGNLTQNRSEKVNYKLSKRTILPRSAWITVADTHEAIICPPDFARTQELLAVHSHQSRSGGGHLLTGLAFCADCGSPMTYVRESEHRTYMVCQGHRRGGRLGLCTSHCAREDFVISAIRTQLQALAQALDGAAMAQALPPDRGSAQLRRQMESAQRKLERCKSIAQSLYADQATGALTRTEFAELFQRNREERAQWEGQLSVCQRQRTLGVAEDDRQQSVRQLLRFEPLDRGVLVALVERVLLHEGKEIEVFFRFCAPESGGIRC